MKTPQLGQVVADVFDTPVTILDGADEGTAWGAALMAKFRDDSKAGRAADWPSFLATQRTGNARRFAPRPESVAVLAGVYARYRHLVRLHGQLESAVGPDAAANGYPPPA